MLFNFSTNTFKIFIQVFSDRTGQDRQNRTGKTGQAEEDSKIWTGRTRLPCQENQDRTART
jgi:hypothetical protein